MYKKNYNYSNYYEKMDMNYTHGSSGKNLYATPVHATSNCQTASPTDCPKIPSGTSASDYISNNPNPTPPNLKCDPDSNGIYRCCSDTNGVYPPKCTKSSPTYVVANKNRCVCGGNGVCDFNGGGLTCAKPCDPGWEGDDCLTPVDPAVALTNRCSTWSVNSGPPKTVTCTSCYPGFELNDDKTLWTTSSACQITKDPFFWSTVLGSGCYCSYDCDNLEECNNCQNGAVGSSVYFGDCYSGCSLKDSNPQTFLNLITGPSGEKSYPWSPEGLNPYGATGDPGTFFSGFRAGLHGMTWSDEPAYSGWEDKYDSSNPDAYTNKNPTGANTLRRQCWAQNGRLTREICTGSYPGQTCDTFKIDYSNPDGPYKIVTNTVCDSDKSRKPSAC